MDAKSLQKINLKLLVVFIVLVRERSVTSAAHKLALSQPAISHALKELRAMFQDELFSRTSVGIVPNHRAQALYDGLAPSLEAIVATIHQQQRVGYKGTTHSRRRPLRHVCAEL